MYSTLATLADPDGLEGSQYLFGETHNDLLSIPMHQDEMHLKGEGHPAVPNSGLQNLHYTESTPSSVHYGDSHDLLESGGSHVSGREERDGSTSSGYMNGPESNHTARPYPHAPRNSDTIEVARKLDHCVSKNSNNTNPRTLLQGPMVLTQNDQSQHGLNVQNSAATNGATKVSSASDIKMNVESESTRRSRKYTPVTKTPLEWKANSSIPASMSWEEFARQCILAAESSRLNPFALHPEEYKLLRQHITHAQVTIYLNIRNAILRLWTRNPLVYVSQEEAVGCARDKRYFNLAKMAHSWLLRNGYINYGCVEVPNTATSMTAKVKKFPQRTVLVVGAGMSGLGCARHLEALFAQLGYLWINNGERPPRVVIVEARPRFGGRVYSHPFHNQSGSTLPPGHRCTAEMGAQIVTGFEHGNPLNAIIRGQLGIPYHGLRDNTILYDFDGTVVEKDQDVLVEKLYNDVLERASVFRSKPAIFRTVEGDRSLMVFGREPTDTGGETIAALEQSNTPLPANATTTASTTEEKPSTGVEKLAGRAYQLSAGSNPNVAPAQAAQNMGWQLQHDTSIAHSLGMESVAKKSTFPTLGQTMDEGIRQYQRILGLKPRDLRLLNWHHANLEYANAVSVNQLSLSGWDQDIGNEFEGEHTEIIGGYQQVPRGLWQCPSKLDVRFKHVLRNVHYTTDEQGIGKAVKVVCANGEVFEADQLVLTAPLGVLKSGSITFQPPLPEWKQEVIERMGFGLLNKVSAKACGSEW